MTHSFVEGTFVKELKNRFLCEVVVDGKTEECYVASSARLGNFINLKNKRVLLKCNKNTSLRTKYSLEALVKTQHYIPLRLNIANEMLHQRISKQYPSKNVQKEILTSFGYKADVFIPGEKQTLYEAKAILSDNSNIIFPQDIVFRATDQLYKLERELVQGTKVFYTLVILNPKIRKITINRTQEEYVHALIRCLKLGMQLQVFKLFWNSSDKKLISNRNISEDILLQLEIC